MATEEEYTRISTLVPQLAETITTEATQIKAQLDQARAEAKSGRDISSYLDAIETSITNVQNFAVPLAEVGDTTSSTDATSGDGAAPENNPGEVVLNGDGATVPTDSPASGEETRDANVSEA